MTHTPDHNGPLLSFHYLLEFQRRRDHVCVLDESLLDVGVGEQAIQPVRRHYNH
jgi:hypothetical protein